MGIPPKRTLLPVACALLVATSGCSFVFMDKVATAGDPTRVPHCTPNNGMVIADALFGAAYLSSSVEAVRGDGPGREDDGAAVLSGALAIAMIASALLHLGEAEKCRRAIAAHNNWIVSGGPR